VGSEKVSALAGAQVGGLRTKMQLTMLSWDVGGVKVRVWLARMLANAGSGECTRPVHTIA
jgi:hypothetical protein